MQRSGDMAVLTAASAWRTAAVSMLLALAVNLFLLGAATVGDAEMRVRPGGASEAITVGPVSVTATTFLPLLLAAVLLVLARGRGPRAWQVLAALGLAIGVLTVLLPVTATASPGTKVVLSLMHVATGLIWFLVVRRAAARGAPGHPAEQGG